MSYDTKCFDLADAFLADQPELNRIEDREMLAQAIQTTIEDWINDMLVNIQAEKEEREAREVEFSGPSGSHKPYA